MPSDLAGRKRLDVITIGRCSVDLYGQQIGSRLEDVTSFAKSVGGCPSNIAIGTARLGLRSGLITRVGDEQMGRYVKEQMAREGVALDGIATDPARLTSLVLLSVENDKTFPLIFYRDNCADSALCEADVDEAFVASSAAVLVTGTHFATPHTDAAQRKAMRIARANGGKVILDIDYRPNLWGLAGHGAGEERYIKSDEVSEHLKTILPDCDLIVGTEEEVHIAAGTEDTLEALRIIRRLSDAVIVLKRGPMGCVVYPDAIPDALDKGLVGKGFPIEVYNVLGAGDSFMSGFLRGWLRGEDHRTAPHGPMPAELSRCRGSCVRPKFPPGRSCSISSPTAAPGRRCGRTRRSTMCIGPPRAAPSRISFWRLPSTTACSSRRSPTRRAPRASDSMTSSAWRLPPSPASPRVRPGFGTLLDDVYGREAMFDAAKLGLWVARPLEQPGSRPLRFEFTQDVGSRLVEWPVTHTIKCLSFYHPDDPPALKEEQSQKLRTLYEAAAQGGPRTADRDHRGQERHARRHDHRARAG